MTTRFKYPAEEYRRDLAELDQRHGTNYVVDPDPAVCDDPRFGVEPEPDGDPDEYPYDNLDIGPALRAGDVYFDATRGIGGVTHPDTRSRR